MPLGDFEVSGVEQRPPEGLAFGSRVHAQCDVSDGRVAVVLFRFDKSQMEPARFHLVESISMAAISRLSV